MVGYCYCVGAVTARESIASLLAGMAYWRGRKAGGVAGRLRSGVEITRLRRG